MWWSLAPLAGHDEDLDLIADREDNCPATSNPSQQATDAVGTACDPRPETGDRIALFVPFFPSGPPSSLMGGPATFAVIGL